MKKSLIGCLLGLILLTGCNTTSREANALNVYSRDASSGTREAFESIIGFSGELTNNAVEVSGNGDMATKVGGDKLGIGYVSLTTDFKRNNIKAMQYEGVEVSIENVINGNYALSRPYSYVTRASGDFGSEQKEQLIIAFLDYLTNSLEGLDIINSAGGVVDTSNAVLWEELQANHPVLKEDNSNIVIKLGGSTSVEDIITNVYQAFEPFTNGASFEVNLTGSGDGYKRVLGSSKNSANTADIGFASREFTSEEDVALGMASGEFARDAIVVVLSNDNQSGVTNFTKQDLYEIFTGKVTDLNTL